MGMFFDGNFKKKRNISFKEPTLSRQQALKNAEEARIEREIQRKKNTAATTIQKNWRRFSSVRKYKQCILQNETNEKTEFNLSKFLFCFDGSKDLMQVAESVHDVFYRKKILMLGLKYNQLSERLVIEWLNDERLRVWFVENDLWIKFWNMFSHEFSLKVCRICNEKRVIPLALNVPQIPVEDVLLDYSDFEFHVTQVAVENVIRVSQHHGLQNVQSIIQIILQSNIETISPEFLLKLTDAVIISDRDFPIFTELVSKFDVYPQVYLHNHDILKLAEKFLKHDIFCMIFYCKVMAIFLTTCLDSDLEIESLPPIIDFLVERYLEDWHNKTVITILKRLHKKDTRMHFYMKWEKDFSLDKLGPSDLLASEDEFSHFHYPRQLELTANVLRNLPFLISFETRLTFLRRVLSQTKERSSLWIDVRRDFILDDAFAALKDESFRKTIKVKFYDSFGLPESGIDAFGLFKEFMIKILKQITNPNYGLFSEAHDHRLYPNKELGPKDMLFFAGQLIGKALLEDVQVNINFASFFVNKLCGDYNTLDDLEALDPNLLKSIMYIKNANREELESLALTFSTDSNFFGTHKEQELIPNGSNINVTLENRLHYIYLLANEKLQAPSSIIKGVASVVDLKYLAVFSNPELVNILQGSLEIDLEDWKSFTLYRGTTVTHPTVISFWEILSKWTHSQRSHLLQFVTSAPIPPALGFRHLDPKFTLTLTDSERIPTCSTCNNLLILPEVEGSDLESKLIFAMEHGEGFHQA